MRSWLGWVIGSLISVIIVSLWRNGEVDWGLFSALNIGGLIGTIIGLGIREVIKNAKSERHN
ncbi:hypothetical protein [Bacillus cecembensis]|uniref:hypothetical protein n=1 Tax=Solibacillus cecembensis TaxID=459347 RepID=UPI00071750DC